MWGEERTEHSPRFLDGPPEHIAVASAGRGTRPAGPRGYHGPEPSAERSPRQPEAPGLGPSTYTALGKAQPQTRQCHLLRSTCYALLRAFVSLCVLFS